MEPPRHEEARGEPVADVVYVLFWVGVRELEEKG